jgi:hypothetical protein
MKKSKKNIIWALLEGLGELVLTLLSLGIGVFIVGLFGVDFESLNINYELIILLGLAVFFVIFGITRAFVQWIIKKILRGKRNQ